MERLVKDSQEAKRRFDELQENLNRNTHHDENVAIF